MTWWWLLLLLLSFLARLLQLTVQFTREEVWEVKVLSIELQAIRHFQSIGLASFHQAAELRA
jgi:hypothetical protein